MQDQTQMAYRTDMSVELDRFVSDFATALTAADAARPRATNARSKVAFQPGIGPHSEAQTVKLVGDELEHRWPRRSRCARPRSQWSCSKRSNRASWCPPFPDWRHPA